MCAENQSKILPSLFETGAVTALLIPLCYTAGWTYAYHYFKHFSLGLIGLDLPREYFFMYGFQAMWDQIWLFLLILITFLSLMIFGKYLLRKIKSKYRENKIQNCICSFIPAIILPVMIFFMFTAFYHLGEKAADDVYNWQRTNDFKTYFVIQVWAKAPETAEDRAEMAQGWHTGCYRLLMQNNDYLFVFQPVKAAKKDETIKIPTDMIPKSKVELVRIYQANTSCEDF